MVREGYGLKDGEKPLRNNKGQFIKGCHYSHKNEFKKGRIPINKKQFPKIELDNLYWNKNKTLGEIANIFKVSIPTIVRQMKEYGIKTRDTKIKKGELKGKTYESLYGVEKARILKQLLSDGHKGEKNNLYGKSPWNKGTLYGKNIGLLNKIKQGLKYKEWRNNVLEKGNYKCVRCKTKKNLIAHHQVPIKILYTRFLKLFKDLSNVELYRLSVNFLPFWNIKNGLVLCKKCHKQIHREMNLENSKLNVWRRNEMANRGNTGRGSSGDCGGKRRRDGSGRGVGNRNTSRQPKRKTSK